VLSHDFPPKGCDCSLFVVRDGGSDRHPFFKPQTKRNTPIA
jgi:hypothetical protein